MRGMRKSLGVALVVLAMTAWMSPGPTAAAEKVFEFKISVDTVPNHPAIWGW